MSAFIEPPGPLQSGLSVINFHLTQPTNPPNAKDVANTVFYAKAVIKAKAISSDVTDEEVSAAVEYQALVVSAKNIEIGIQTNRLNQSIEELKTSINGLRDSIVGLQDKVHEVKTTTGLR